MMKTIIVKDDNSEKIMQLFREVQGKSTSRIIENYSQLVDIISDVERRVSLNNKMSKRAFEGTKVVYSFKQKFPSAYKYMPYSTHFTLEYVSGKWYIIDESIKRLPCPNRSGYEYDLILSDSAKEAILGWYV